MKSMYRQLQRGRKSVRYESEHKNMKTRLTHGLVPIASTLLWGLETPVINTQDPKSNAYCKTRGQSTLGQSDQVKQKSLRSSQTEKNHVLTA
jgi:hypothetical protein